MRYLGIDYGTKRIGLALSDEEGMMAYPFSVIDHKKDTLSTLIDIIENEKVDEVVIGLSQNQSGNDNEIMSEVHDFVGQISVMKPIPVHLEKEAFTSVEAARLSGYDGLPRKKQANQRGREKGKKHIDDSAAALILQRFLDKNHT